jgi:hypothetical protein
MIRCFRGEGGIAWGNQILVLRTSASLLMSLDNVWHVDELCCALSTSRRGVWRERGRSVEE